MKIEPGSFVSFTIHRDLIPQEMVVKSGKSKIKITKYKPVHRGSQLMDVTGMVIGRAITVADLPGMATGNHSPDEEE